MGDGTHADATVDREAVRTTDERLAVRATDDRETVRITDEHVTATHPDSPQQHRTLGSQRGCPYA